MSIFKSFSLFCMFASIVNCYEYVNVNVSQPQNNAPLNTTLVYYRLSAANGRSEYLSHGFYKTSCGANLSFHYTDPSVYKSKTGSKKLPILILTHGYPESSYIWRELTSDLSLRVPLFVPDQPGYGLSSICTTPNVYDKQSYAEAIFEALVSVYGPSHVILAGHDRGARTMHRAAVSNNFTGITPLGVFMADIVPLIAEYSSFSNPANAVGYFHWSFLPRGEFATDVIMAYGGGNWVKKIFAFASGTGETPDAVPLFQSGNAWDVYANFFDQLSVTNASVFDYQAGATTDYYAQLADQAAGRKIQIPAHVLFSEANLGAQFNVSEVWSDYVDPSAGLTVKGIGGGRGHFIVEEGPKQTLEQLHEFMDRLHVQNEVSPQQADRRELK